MTFDWTPAQPDPARRLFQVRLALEVLPLSRDHRGDMEEFAQNLEKKFTRPTHKGQERK